jgi:hypothetical protein
MGDYYDSNYYDYNEYDYDPNADYDENDDTYAYLDDEDDEEDYLNSLDKPLYVTEIWKQLRVKQGDEYYMCNVSNRGRVKPCGVPFYDCIATEGTRFNGTPYMVTHLGNRDYYIHELVWRAFIGPIRPGYHIRHKTHYVNKCKKKTYNNRVECLEEFINTLGDINEN